MTIRLQRIMGEQGQILMVPMDHGISMGAAPGISPPDATIAAVAPQATCITTHKGLVRKVAPHARDVGVMLHLSASTDLCPDPNEKRLVATVEEAVRMGCDGVSTHLNLGSQTEADMIESVGAVSTACQLWNMPHVAMVYPRGPSITNPFEETLVAHAARLAAELGADVAKVPYTGDPDSFRNVTRGAGIPVIVAGGPQAPDFASFLNNLKGAKEGGASGVSIGRNVFQHEDSRAAMDQIAAIFA
ncbi:MAG: 2-amino-3,7-dideoxy-D-threo-hept-6-ulosonate synthase [Thermoplasmatota archaeon]